MYGIGLMYWKIGGCVVYVVDDLKVWVDCGVKMLMFDFGKGMVLLVKK